MTRASKRRENGEAVPSIPFAGRREKKCKRGRSGTGDGGSYPAVSATPPPCALRCMPSLAGP
jgi:hypothetical protein